MLDALPGNIRAGDTGRKDHPADLIAALQLLQLPISDRRSVLDYLAERGFSEHIAKWISTNLRPMVEVGGCQGADYTDKVSNSLVWVSSLSGFSIELRHMVAVGGCQSTDL